MSAIRETYETEEKVLNVRRSALPHWFYPTPRCNFFFFSGSQAGSLLCALRFVKLSVSADIGVAWMNVSRY